MDELTLYRKLLGDPNYQVGKKLPSPIPFEYRGKIDDTASFSTKYYGNRIRWRDFGFNEKSYDVVELAAYVLKTYPDREKAEELIDADKIEISPISFQQKFANIKVPLNFQKTSLKWYHLLYFEQLGITFDILRKFRVTGLESISVPGNKPFWKGSRANFGFHYTIGEGEKSYRPFNLNYKGKKEKYLHQRVNIPEGWDQLVGGKLVVFTKSLKDVMFLHPLGYQAISLGSETMFSEIEPFVEQLQFMFDDFVFWGDPDPAGVKYSAELKKMFGKGRIANSLCSCFDYKYCGKDPTDIWINTKERKVIDLIISCAS